MRGQIFTGVGRAVEQYVKLFGNTKGIEENFERRVFGSYWKQDPRCLSEPARHALISGEYVWHNYQGVTLQDWAAPAIQYCRALEFECNRRFYIPCPNTYMLTKAGFTLGTITTAYLKRSFDREANNNWETLLWRVSQSRSDLQEFQQIVQRMVDESIIMKRNLLAHGGAVTGEIAASLRRSIIGDRTKPGVLCWLAEYVEPV